MVNHQLIKPVFQGTHMEVVGRSETGEKVIMSDYSHTSHFYVPEDAYVPDHPAILAVETINDLDPDYDHIPFPLYGSIKKEKLKRIWVRNPTDVSDLRDEFYPESWEADIKYRRRYLIDKGIENGFNENLEPVDFELPPVIGVVDIEVLNRKKQEFEELVKRLNEPVVIVGLRFTGDEKPIVIVVDREQHRHEVVHLPDRILMYVQSEVHLHIWFWKILKKKFPDVLTGWNVDFDVDYMKGRGKKLAELSGKYNVELRKLLEENFIKYINVFDSMQGYNRLYEPVRKGLKFIARILGISKRSEWGGALFSETYLEHQEEGVQYNLDDVNDTWNIIELVNLIQYYWEDKNFTGVEELRLTFFNSIKIDTVCLRHAMGRYALPTAPKYEEKPEGPQFEGAFVLPPVRGVHEHVGLFDFSRFYPAMVKSKNISYEIPIGHPETGFMPEIIDIFWEARDRVEDELEKLTPGTPEYKILHPKKMSRKFLLNAVWGVFGDVSFRLYDKIKAGMITKLCRAGIKMLIQFAKKLGFISLYGDTDSVFIHIPAKIIGKLKDVINAVVDKGQWIAEKLNKAFKTVFKTDLINVKLEKVWNPLCLTSVKKKYFGRVVWEEGKFIDRVVTKGMESVRRDSSELTKKVQEKLFNMILYGQVDKVLSYLKKVFAMAKAEKFTLDAIAIGKGLSKNPDKYKANTDYIRGSRYANKHYYKKKIMKGGMRAFMFFCKQMLDPELPKYDVICLADPKDFDRTRIKIDPFKTIDRNLEKPLEHLLDISGLKWSDVKGQIKLGALIKR